MTAATYCVHCAFVPGARHISVEDPRTCTCACHVHAAERKNASGPSLSMPKVRELGGEILARHRFVTLEDTREILVYDTALGVYVPNADTLIAATVRARLESVPDARSVAHTINEVTTWVRYTNVVDRKDFDADPAKIVGGEGVRP